MEIRTARPGRLFFLMIALFAVFLLYPVLAPLESGIVVLDLGFSGILVLSVWSVSRNRTLMIIALVLAVPTMTSRWLEYLLPHQGVLLAAEATTIAFYFFVAFELLYNLLKDKEVTLDTIYGAISVYLLLGLAWAAIYSFLELGWPGSLNMGVFAQEYADGTARSHGAYSAYFSFVTLSTLGYGDITPVSPAARTLAMLEAVIGQMYIAVLIARLVGMHISQQQVSRDD